MSTATVIFKATIISVPSVSLNHFLGGSESDVLVPQMQKLLRTQLFLGIKIL